MNATDNITYRFFIKTLGCKVNQYESQAMRELLLKEGFKECPSKEIADIFIINTCTVTHKADTESRHWASVFHKTNPDARIIITGCCAEKDAAAFSFLPGVTNIVRNDDKGVIADIIKGQAVAHGPDKNLKITDFKGHSKAFVKIEDGCDNFCAYCKVPHVRGAPRSKPLNNIIEEVGELASKGFKEIVLTGICLGAWGVDINGKSGIVDVLKALKDIPGDFRIRLSSIEPKHVTDGLIGHMAKDNRICRHLHVPIQSGDDSVLKNMNRPYTSKQIKDTIIKVKDKVPGIGITTDILVGFPGESEENFNNTVELIKDIRPVKTHIFPFSSREGTPASCMEGQLPHDIIKNRFQRLNAVAVGASYLYREGFLGKTVNVLVESKRGKHSGKLIGYSDNYIRLVFDGPDSAMKTVVPVKIEELNLTYTLGTLVEL